ncbi:SHIPPO repeat domain-containing protein [Giardia muris]|uniref:SHIPPO repeat domain-containing protein n=1 Tax=Giardia muris TaxID=5742 RepID=A0A4Z1STX8_GIAMU|nr:SHIPPO repeat domain-containing protein [Giardia muris]|eukprot:TNJ29372.1 SHIPPO repeat domain-containing protein [Giardia muris]
MSSWIEYVSEGPGPGAYNPRLPSHGTAVNMNRSSRTGWLPDPQDKGLKKRGPGQTHGYPKFLTEGGSLESPGPGSYTSRDLDLKAKSPSFSMSGRVRPASGIRRSSIGGSFIDLSGQAHEITPGPGAYDARLGQTRPRSPASSFGVRTKRPELPKDAPGPGAYNIATKLGGPSFSFGSRSPLRKPESASPGPGAYTPKLRDNGPSFSMSGRTVIRRYVV